MINQWESHIIFIDHYHHLFSRRPWRLHSKRPTAKAAGQPAPARVYVTNNSPMAGHGLIWIDLRVAGALVRSVTMSPTPPTRQFLSLSLWRVFLLPGSRHYLIVHAPFFSFLYLGPAGWLAPINHLTNMTDRYRPYISLTATLGLQLKRRHPSIYLHMEWTIKWRKCGHFSFRREAIKPSSFNQKKFSFSLFERIENWHKIHTFPIVTSHRVRWRHAVCPGRSQVTFHSDRPVSVRPATGAFAPSVHIATVGVSLSLSMCVCVC